MNRTSTPQPNSNDARSISGSSQSPIGYTTPGHGGYSGGRGGLSRSASLPTRSLAGDMRKIAGLFRAPTVDTDAGAGMYDLTATPTPSSTSGAGGAAAAGQASANQQYNLLVERVSAVMTNMLRQRDSDARAAERRIQQLERGVGSLHEEWSSSIEWREKWAEVQGSLNGLFEEMQTLARRVEGLDERLWARTSGLDLAKQRSHELEQQVQSLEHQHQLGAAALEVTQKRQAAKVCRAERNVEELSRRLAQSEEFVRQLQQAARPRPSRFGDSPGVSTDGRPPRGGVRPRSSSRGRHAHGQESFADDVADEVCRLAQRTTSTEAALAGLLTDVEQMQAETVSRSDGMLQEVGNLDVRMRQLESWFELMHGDDSPVNSNWPGAGQASVASTETSPQAMVPPNDRNAGGRMLDSRPGSVRGELALRLNAIEERLESHCGLVAAQVDEAVRVQVDDKFARLTKQISAEFEEFSEYHQQELGRTKDTVDLLAEQIVLVAPKSVDKEVAAEDGCRQTDVGCPSGALAERLAAVEDRLEASCERAAVQADESVRRHMLEASAAIGRLEEQVASIETRCAHPAPKPAGTSALTALLEKEFAFLHAEQGHDVLGEKAVPGSEDQVLFIDESLQRLQAACLQSAEGIAIATQRELQELQALARTQPGAADGAQAG